MDFTWIVIVIVFFLLDKGHEAEILPKVCLFFFLHYILFTVHLSFYI